MNQAFSHDLLVIAATIALCWATERGMRWWLRGDNEARVRKAEQVLEQHGLDAFFYMPGVGEVDEALRAVLDCMECTGKIVLDKNGSVVGRLVPKVAKSPHLRLVVDNT